MEWKVDDGAKNVIIALAEEGIVARRIRIRRARKK
jgi:hypothetical protein